MNFRFLSTSVFFSIVLAACGQSQGVNSSSSEAPLSFGPALSKAVSEPAIMDAFACGEHGDKVRICHIPPGNPDAAHTICVGRAAIQAHVKEHGDCEATSQAHSKAGGNSNSHSNSHGSSASDSDRGHHEDFLGSCDGSSGGDDSSGDDSSGDDGSVGGDDSAGGGDTSGGEAGGDTGGGTVDDGSGGDTNCMTCG